MPFTMMPPAITVLTSSLAAATYLPGRCTSRSRWWIGGGFRPAVVDFDLRWWITTDLE